MNNVTTQTRLFFLSGQMEDLFDFVGDFVHIRCTDTLLSCNNDQMALPSSKFHLEKEITEDRLQAWLPVVDWLSNLIGRNDYLVFRHNDPLIEIGLLAVALRRFRFVVAFVTAPTKILTSDYSIFGSAAFFLFANAKVEGELRKVYVQHYYSSPPHAKAETPEIAAVSEPTDPEISTGGRPRILLVSYFFRGSRSVGAQRTTYWHDRVPELWPGSTVITVTATPDSSPDNRVLVIPDLGCGHLLDTEGDPLSWAKAFIETERNHRRNFSTLSYYWRIGLEKFFQTRNDSFDLVIISGNPFSAFDFSAFAKRQWSSQVVLDYRDPFSNNPRMLFSPEQREWARYIEKGYNLQADLVTVVNAACVPMVEADMELPVAVIPNGFDERQIGYPLELWSKKDGRINFIHVGNFRRETSPKPMINCLDSALHCFHHVGNSVGPYTDVIATESVILHGFATYDRVLDLISRADCGVVFVSESGFDTPTKMYDYLAHGLDLLILTDGSLKTGAVAESLDGLEGVYWVANTVADLAAFLRTYTPSPDRREKRKTHQFSRQAATERLLKEIGRLLDHTRGEL